MDAISITLVFLVFAVVMFIWEKIPLSITAMVVAIGLNITGILTPKEVFNGFVDSNVLLFMAMFIVGAAFFETGVAAYVGSLVTKFAKTERMLLVAVMGITGILSGFLSNTGTAAVLIPVVIGIANSSGLKITKLLMPLSMAAAMGGNLSLIGAPGNMIAQSNLESILHIKFGFFDYGIIGLPVLIIGILFFTTIGFKLLPNQSSRTPDSTYEQIHDYSEVPMWKKWIASIVLIATIVGMIFEDYIGIKLYITAWSGALVLVATGVINETQAVKSIDMKTILLFVGSLALASSLVKTGAGTLIATTIINTLGTNPDPFIMMTVLFLITAILTNVMSNTAACALMVPIAISLSAQIGADPKAVLVAIVIGSSCAYATPIGMPANTMVYNVAGYSFMDYIKAGGPLVIVSIIVSLVLLPIFFPFYP